MLFSSELSIEALNQCSGIVVGYRVWNISAFFYRQLYKNSDVTFMKDAIIFSIIAFRGGLKSTELEHDHSNGEDISFMHSFLRNIGLLGIVNDLKDKLG